MENIIVIFSALLVVVVVTQAEGNRGRSTEKVHPLRNMQGDVQFEVDSPKCIEHKLIEQSRALGNLLKIAKNNEQISKTLLEKVDKLADNLPQIHTEAPVPSRRSFSRSGPGKLSPFAKLGKEVTNYGKFYKHLLFDRVDDDGSSPVDR